MTISRRLTDSLLASIFIAQGWNAVREPSAAVDVAPIDGDLGAEALPAATETAVSSVRINGAVQIAGGALLAVGKFRRLATLALIGSLAPATYAGIQAWREGDENLRAEQRTELLKNVGLLGALVLAGLDREAASIRRWGKRRRNSDVTTVMGHLPDGIVHPSTSKAADVTITAGRRAKRAAKAATRQANVAVVSAARHANEAARHANEVAAHTGSVGAEISAPYVRTVEESALDAARTAIEIASPYIAAGVERAGTLLAKVPDYLPEPHLAD